jgi:Cellulose binding domain
MRQRLREFLPWAPTLLAVGSLLALLVLSAGRLLPDDSTPGSLPPPQPAFTLPDSSTGPQAPISLIPSPPRSRPAGSPPTDSVPEGSSSLITSRPVPTKATKPPQSPQSPVKQTVTGRFRVVDSYPDSFIGEVALTNVTGEKQDWTARVTFPAGVDDLRTSWLESLPQPTLDTRGRTFAWTSTVPLEPGATELLRFHFERSGTTETPARCAVNGTSCG